MKRHLAFLSVLLLCWGWTSCKKSDFGSLDSRISTLEKANSQFTGLADGVRGIAADMSALSDSLKVFAAGLSSDGGATSARLDAIGKTADSLDAKVKTLDDLASVLSATSTATAGTVLTGTITIMEKLAEIESEMLSLREQVDKAATIDWHGKFDDVAAGIRSKLEQIGVTALYKLVYGLVDELEELGISIRALGDSLRVMVQSLVFMPTDGKEAVVNVTGKTVNGVLTRWETADEALTLDYMVLPRSSAAALAAKWQAGDTSVIRLKCARLQTRSFIAGEPLKIKSVDFNASDSLLSITAEVSAAAAGVVDSQGGTLAVVCEINTGLSCVASESVEVGIRPIGTTEVLEAVDLGLSVNWANINLGAVSPEEYGDYYAWGATDPHYEIGYAGAEDAVWKPLKEGGYNWFACPYCDDNNGYGFSKYLTDGIRKLEAGDDAVQSLLGGGWRMPTAAEFAELLNEENCKRERCEANGVSGWKFISVKPGFEGNTLFLPSAGYRDATRLVDDGVNAYYWSNSLHPDNFRYATGLSSSAAGISAGNTYRYLGQSIRPVTRAVTTDTVLLWKNDGSVGFATLASGPYYRYAGEGHSTTEELYTFPSADWERLKSGDFYVVFEAQEGVDIHVTTGWWGCPWPLTNSNYFPFATDNGDGTYSLKINFKGHPILNLIDEQHLLIAGEGFRIDEIYWVDTKERETVHNESDREVIWENDGSLGACNWGGTYRFAVQGRESGEECYAFPSDKWKRLKSDEFYVDIEASSPQIKVTTGWWSTTWAGGDITPGNERLTDNQDGTFTLKINFEGDPILDSLDEQHLLLTGQNYKVLRIYYYN